MDAKPLKAVDDALVQEVVETTGAHERTVLRRLAGLPVRGAAGRAVDAALRARGFERPTQSDSDPPPRAA